MKLALAAVLALAYPAAAHDLPGQPSTHGPEILWLDAPTAARAAEGRIRLVRGEGTTVAALTVDQYWHYQQAFRKHLTRVSYRSDLGQTSIRQAQARAIDDLLRVYPSLRVAAFRVDPVD